MFSPLHLFFDVLAWATAASALVWCRRTLPQVKDTNLRPGYLLSVIGGALIGGMLLGTANLWLAGVPGLGRSILGALVGAIFAVELYKWARGITESTGAAFALPITLGIAVGRLGCFASGLDDFTYGTPSSLPWAYDFGDGIARHPVQLYEAATMLLLAGGLWIWMRRAPDSFLRLAFPVFCLIYASSRFIWEFMKPYPETLFGLTIFQIVNIVFLIYALARIMSESRPHAQNPPL